MANTLRESTARQRSDNSHALEELTQLSTWGYGPHSSNAADKICQETASVPLPLREPLISQIANAASTALTSHRRTNGATVSVLNGNLVGQKLYSVSIYPRRTIELDSTPSWRQLFAYALTTVDILLAPGRALVTWFDEERRLHVLDVVVCCPEYEVAVILGLRFGKCAIYDLAEGVVINIARPSTVALTPGGGRDA